MYTRPDRSTKIYALAPPFCGASAATLGNEGGKMNRSIFCALAGASLATIASTATAQTMVAAAPAAAPAATLGEIVVTARRRAESLQEVPQTVNAVTADTLQKFNITDFTQIQAVTPGLTLTQQRTSPVSASASLRGVTYSALDTGGAPTVASYINDAPSAPVETFQSLFDVGQIEVLKGPQGTVRGVSAPSGAITVTTRRPDLSTFGGYVSGQLTDLQGRNVQGALNIPIIKDVLAVRLAGVFDQNDLGGVRSIYSSARPYGKTAGERVSVSFEPNDAFNAHLLYQHMDHWVAGFQQVVGPGAGRNPPITGDMRAAVQSQPSIYQQHFDRVNINTDSRIFGQHLQYVGSYVFLKFKNASSVDVGGVLAGANPQQTIYNPTTQTTHELRLSSDPAPGRFFDYVVGGFYSWSSFEVFGGQPATLLPGAFGPPNLPPNTAAFNPSFSIPVVFGGPPNTNQETSIYGSVTFHLGPNTELSGGVRHISSIVATGLVTQIGNGQIALPASFFGGNCAAAHFASTYSGFCDFPLKTAAIISNTTDRTSQRANVYNVSLSHHLTRDVLVYANTGTSFGAPNPSFSLQGGITASANPAIRALSFHPAETSRGYEVGLKSTFFDSRARLNLALFRQRFAGLRIGVPGVSYFNTATGSVSQADMQPSVDALVQGVDFDAAWQITPKWNISAQGSYAHTNIQNSLVPCNVPGAVLNDPNFVSLCPGTRGSRLPLWNLTAQSEYVRPVRDNVDGFIRGLFNYYPENKYSEPNYVAPSYSLLNLYVGLRSHDGAWEASLFASNVASTSKLLDRSPQQISLGGLTSSFPTINPLSGYSGVTEYTPRREVGVSIRYAWGSR
jgi:iron complex outermembrane receptor protein